MRTRLTSVAMFSVHPRSQTYRCRENLPPVPVADMKLSGELIGRCWEADRIMRQ